MVVQVFLKSRQDVIFIIVFESQQKTLHKLLYNRLFYKFESLTLLLELNIGKANQPYFSNIFTRFYCENENKSSLP